MARPRTPTETLRARGAFEKNPQRKRSDPKTAGPIGDPPDALPVEMHDLWRELVEIVPIGVLTCADRWALEDLVRLKWQRRCGDKWTMAQQAAANWLYSHFGMTPSDRSKVNAKPEEGEADPAEKYFN